MTPDSKILTGSATLVRGWHPVDPEGYSPYSFATPKEELLAARSTAWIGVYLMVTGHIDFSGPDAVKALNAICTNRDFSTLKIGASRHGLVCNEKGYITENGIVTRLSEDKFRCYCIFCLMDAPKIGFDVKAEMVDEFFIQVDGPKSLEIIEEACQSDVHDLKFGQNKMIRIADADVFIHRLGMSGALAYELHGEPQYADDVYTALAEAGKKYGAVRQGVRTYMSNHTQGGYANQFGHFVYPDPEGKPLFGMTLSGSCSDDVNNYYVTPYDVGWGNMVNFDHEFPGKAALQAVAANPRKTPVTLEWNLDDVMQLYRDEFLEQSVEADEGIFDYDFCLPEFRRVHADYVVAGEKKIGIASGRIKDYFDKTFISLAFLDKDYAQEGREVQVMWGKPGKEQRAIRATVARFPYYNGEYRNEVFDVNNIPRRFPADK